MASSVGSLFVSLGLNSAAFQQGLYNTRQRLGLLREVCKDLGKDFKRMARGFGAAFSEMASKAKWAFGGILAAIGKFSEIASPSDWDDFRSVLGEISVLIGAVLAPLLRQFTTWLARLRDYLKQLTPEQAEQIRGWVQFALAVTGAISALYALNVALMALSANPILAICAAVIMLTALLVKSNEAWKDRVAARERWKKGDIAKEDVKDPTLRKIVGSDADEQEGKLERYEKYLKDKRAELEKAKADAQAEGRMAGGNTGKAGGYQQQIHDLDDRLAQVQGMKKKLHDDGLGALGNLDSQSQAPIKLRPKPAELLSVVDAWRKAQTANVESPEARIEQMQLKVLQDYAEQQRAANDWASNQRERIINGQGAGQ